MGKIYNGTGVDIDDIDTQQEMDDIVDTLNKIGSWVNKRNDVKFRDEEIKRTKCST